jgi:two-component system, NtrC family, nitrogen regulation sensor histidine kinase NtrY
MKKLGAIALVALPGAVVAALFSSWSAAAIAFAAAFAMGLVVTARVERRVRTLASVLAAYREGDYAIRSRGTTVLLSELEDETNALGDVLRSHRLGEMEAWSLLRKVLSEVDVVVLAFDDRARIRLANESAAKLLGKASQKLVGLELSELGLDEDLLGGAAPRIVAIDGERELRRGTFRLSGEPHTLVVLSDIGHALREREREAWQRIVRVMGHEINNSLSPIVSISDSLRGLVRDRVPDSEEDLKSGLDVIARRAEALARFTSAYAALARVPTPQKKALRVIDLAEKLRAIVPMTEVIPGPDIFAFADPDLLEQAMINLLKNAVEATKSGVRLRWSSDPRSIELAVEDDGPGVTDATSLFVPFFTTKAGGSGIGLALARQIVEAHDGTVSLTTRTDGVGAIARVRLPLAQ